jgi:hypothetical protein
VSAGAPSIDLEYQTRLESRRVTLAARERAHVWVSRARLILVLIGVALLIRYGAGAANAVAVLLVAFIAAAVVHARLLTARDRARSAVQFYERGIDRRAYRWMGHGDPGDRHRQAEHPYADDLDVFGRGSLFELLATTRTRAGQDTLARWLLEPAPPGEIRARQDAVRELATRLDLREAVAVTGDAMDVGVHATSLRAWATAPINLGSTPQRVFMLALAATTVVVSVTAFAIDALPVVLARTLFGVFVVQGIAVLVLRGRVVKAISRIDEPASDLGLLSGVLGIIEREPFTSARLVALASALGGSSRKASAEIGKLDQLVALLRSRTNLMFAIPAAALAWATQVAFAIEAWRARVGVHVPRWLDAVGDFEALVALATYAAEHPANVFPDLVDGPATIDADALAHPLLPDTAVANDIHLLGSGPRLLVVSGSNMSGKSTFMRAVGLNVVLAQAGAPVRATRLRLSPLRVGASIRIVDSLQDGRSRFMAEILRLKQVLDLARDRPGTMLFLLDEILAGTNSHDRRIGAEALIGGLLDAGAIGLVTTHDLALGEIATRLGAAAANVHFADAFDAGGLSFDYRLRPGIVRTSNAIALMRSIGLDVPEG